MYICMSWLTFYNITTCFECIINMYLYVLQNLTVSMKAKVKHADSWVLWSVLSAWQVRNKSCWLCECVHYHVGQLLLSTANLTCTKMSLQPPLNVARTLWKHTSKLLISLLHHAKSPELSPMRDSSPQCWGIWDVSLPVRSMWCKRNGLLVLLCWLWNDITG